MLNEFLVLGQVPGTNFQITFSQLLLFLDVGLLVLLLRRHNVLTELKYYGLYLTLYASIKRSQLFSRPAVLIERTS